MNKSKEIYRCYGTGLGDVISGLMLYRKWSMEKNEISRVSTWYSRRGKMKDYKGKATEIVPLIDPTYHLELTDEAATAVHTSDEGILFPFTRTVKKWIPSDSKIVTYQFDGKSHREKNFYSFDDWDYIINFLIDLGYDPVRVGDNMTIKECAELMAISHSFVGVPSGMGVLNLAVGAPHFMIRNNLGAEWLQRVRYGSFMLMKNKEQYKRLFSMYHEQSFPFYKKWCINPDLFIV